MSRGRPVIVPDHAAEALAAADFAGLDRPGADGWLSPHRRGELQGHVRPLAVVVVDVLGEQVVQVPGSKNNEVVEALNLDALNQSFDVGVEVRRR